MEELWKDIEDYEGLYQISNLGRVKSLYRKAVYSNGKIVIYNEKILSLSSKNDNGYICIALNKNNKRKTYRLHRLVAKAFCENINPSKYDIVNHIDGNKENNTSTNLEWTDQSGNMIHASKHGLINFNYEKLKDNGLKQAKSVCKLDDNMNILETYISIKEAARQNNIKHPGGLSSSIKKKVKSGGYYWKYK